MPGEPRVQRVKKISEMVNNSEYRVVSVIEYIAQALLRFEYVGLQYVTED
jgi:hypothetical protein